MSPDTSSGDEEILLAFAIELELDAAEGILRPLGDYLARHPGHEAVIRAVLERRQAALAESRNDDLLAQFAAAYGADRAAGAVRTLAEYLQDFPGAERELAERYAALDSDRFEPDAGDEHLAPGSTLGPYRIERLLGSGGQGTVYRAHDPRLQRTVAVKVLAATGARGDALLRRFRREALAASRLAHPAICTVLETGRHGGLAWLAMTHVEGESLATRIAAARATTGTRTDLVRERDDETRTGTRPPPFGGILRLVEEVARALHVAHEAGIVHRDVKPANVMVATGERPVVLDFGLARDDSSDAEALTLSGDLLGTPAYMAPEQIESARGVIDRRTDVYALGVLLYECVTLRRPFESATTAGLYRAVLDGVAASPRRLQPAVSRDLATVISHAMERDPERRYPTAQALAEDLARVCRREPVLARPVGAAVRVRRWAERNPLVALAAAALTIAAISIIAWTATKNAELNRAYAEARWLADAKLVEAYESAMLHVPSARPEDTPALDAWLLRADELAARAGLHRERLVALRMRAMPYGPGDAERDATTHPEAGDLAGAVKRLHRLTTHEHLDEAAARNAIADVRAEIAALEPRVRTRRTWRFMDTGTQWEHDVLAELVRRLEHFVAPPYGTLPLMRAARERLATIARDSLELPAAAWTNAIRAVAADPRYRGLELTPQIGLVPLGPDPASGLQEFAHIRSGEPAVRRPDGSLAFDASCGVVLVLLPGGRFTMGATPPSASRPIGTANVDDRAAKLSEPPHELELAPFFLAKFELTQAQYLRFRGDNTSLYLAGERVGKTLLTGQNPAENVSWFTADELTRMMGLALPTEAQWEYGARAGSTTIWWTGNDRETLRGCANLADRSIATTGVRIPSMDDWPDLDDGWPVHAPAGTFRANPFGLHDTAGNVSEWCLDPLLNYGFAARAGDGLRTTPEHPPMRVWRGGCFGDTAHELRSALRGSSNPGSHSNTLGLRPARAIDGQ